MPTLFGDGVIEAVGAEAGIDEREAGIDVACIVATERSDAPFGIGGSIDGVAVGEPIVVLLAASKGERDNVSSDFLRKSLKTHH